MSFPNCNPLCISNQQDQYLCPLCYSVYFCNDECAARNKDSHQSVCDIAANRSCLACSKSPTDVSAPLRPCSSCYNAWYCSKECQKADWISHKAQCNPRRVCAVCKTSATHIKAPIGYCTACYSISYCSKACQSADWKDHKQICAKVASVACTVCRKSPLELKQALEMCGLDCHYSFCSAACRKIGQQTHHHPISAISLIDKYQKGEFNFNPKIKSSPLWANISLVFDHIMCTLPPGQRRAFLNRLHNIVAPPNSNDFGPVCNHILKHTIELYLDIGRQFPLLKPLIATLLTDFKDAAASTPK